MEHNWISPFPKKCLLGEGNIFLKFQRNFKKVFQSEIISELNAGLPKHITCTNEWTNSEVNKYFTLRKNIYICILNIIYNINAHSYITTVNKGKNQNCYKTLTSHSLPSNKLQTSIT